MLRQLRSWHIVPSLFHGKIYVSKSNIISLHTYHSRSTSKGQQRHLSETSTFYRNDLAMRNTAVFIIVVLRLQTWQVVTSSPSDRSPSQVCADKPLIAFYDIHEWKEEKGRKREALFFCSVPDATRYFILIKEYWI
jgi:hypothetical protein